MSSVLLRQWDRRQKIDRLSYLPRIISMMRYAIRTLLRDRAFALMVILSLAVGIGANTAIFSLVNGVLLRPPAYPAPETLVAVTMFAPRFLKSYPTLPVSIAFFEAWRKRVTSFESIGISQ